MQRKSSALVMAVALGLACTGVRADTGDTTLSGKMYVDFTHIDQTLSGRDTDASGFGLDVKRFYLEVGHRLDPVWSLHLTTDFNYVSNDGETNLFVKKAYVQGRFSDAAVLRVGSAGTPWIGLVEDYYGYRYVEKTLLDRLKFGNSADWGLHLGGESGSGRLNYAVSVINGAGYKHATRGKGMDVAARVGFVPVEGMIVALGGYTGTRGKETANLDAEHTARRGDVMLAWSGNGLRFGGEYFRAENWNTVLDPRSETASGWSAWGSVDLGDDMALFARYDRARPGQGARDTYAHAGIAFQVTKGFKLAAAYKYGRSHAALPVPVADAPVLRTREVGVWGEVKF